jgi:tRNA threonylcarbamoyladenosine biosynthesis protein TsaE
MENFFISSSLQMQDFAHRIAKNILPKQTIALYGTLGVGKSFFAKNFINFLQDQPSEILSPTFNLVYQYETTLGKVFHFDLYRLKTSDELENIGFFDILQNHITLIEWPQIAEKYLPKNCLQITIKNVFDDNNALNEEARQIIVEHNE